MSAFDVAGLSVAIHKLIGTQFAHFYLQDRQGPIANQVSMDDLFQILELASVAFRQAGLMRSLAKVDRSTQYFKANSSHCERAAIETDLRNIRETVLEELGEHTFFKVATDRAEYFGRDRLFGAVWDAFEAAREDIREAGNCLALERSTAAVFHLMRVAEHGLRALAYDRRIKVPKGRPLNLATWEDIIRELEKAEDEIRGFKQTLAREAQYEFYHGAMMQFRGFKNAFRNQIMHTRKSYDRDRAVSIFKQVREFMQILASRIADKKRTPKVWKGAKWIIGA